LVHPFQQVFEGIEAALPEAGHLRRPFGERGQGGGLGAVVGLAAVRAWQDEASLEKDGEVF